MQNQTPARAAPLVYWPLRGSEIRVLVIHPLNKGSSTVSCSLSQAPLETLAFTALSYVWGNANDTVDIYVDTKPLKVTVNLEAYLRKVANEQQQEQQEPQQRPSNGGKPAYLWVDAVCIDQSNMQERNTQVQRMDSIYSEAQEVIVWLGYGDGRTQLGNERIRELARATDPDLGLVRTFIDPEKRAALSEHVKMTMTGDSDKQEGLFEVFRFSWWSRHWVLQELALAKKAVFISGQETLSFQDIYLAVAPIALSLFQDPMHTLKVLNLTNDEESLLARVFSVVHTRSLFEDNYSDRFTATRLQSLLRFSARTKASDPRDKIYGLLGIASDPGKKDIQPRYDLPVQQVYLEIVVWHLGQYDSLSILGQCFAGFSQSLLDMPSWVPHWEPKHKDDDGPVPFRWQPYEDLTSKVELMPYHASRDLPLSAHEWSVDQVSSRLTLTGARLGQITFLSDVAQLDETTLREKPFSIAKEWLALDSRFGEKYSFTGESTNLTLRRIMVADFYNHFTPVQNGVKAKQRDFMLMLPDDPVLHIGGGEWDYRDSMLAYTNTVDKRRIAQSSKGWIGLVPSTAKVGDLIVVLVGGPVLYIVRDTGKRTGQSPGDDCVYSLVGEAFFQGFMDGEAMEGQDLGPIVLG